MRLRGRFDTKPGVLSANAFHEKAGRSQEGPFIFSLDKVFSPPPKPLSPPFHPHSSKSDFRSVPVGCSRFSRCCHLFVDLCFHLRMEAGPGDRRSHRNSALGFCFSFRRTFLTLCRGRQCSLLAVAQWFVRFSADPQAVQPHRQLSRRRNHRAFLPILPAAFGQLQSPTP